MSEIYGTVSRAPLQVLEVEEELTFIISTAVRSEALPPGKW